jgi:hypothetical protein
MKSSARNSGSRSYASSYSRKKSASVPTSVSASNYLLSFDRILMFLFVMGVAILLYFYSIGSGRAPKAEIVGIDPAMFLISKPSAVSGGFMATPNLNGMSGLYDVLNDPYMPPVKTDGYVFDSSSSDIRGLPPLIAPIQTAPNMFLPVNVETHGINSSYSQVGILTKDSAASFSKISVCSDCGENETNRIENKLILPLMGRRHSTGRDKWQYYTISNTGNLNTKLPIRVNGRSCTSEYGCDQMMSGDKVFVEGYEHGFKATIYDNNIFSYIPVF